MRYGISCGKAGLVLAAAMVLSSPSLLSAQPATGQTQGQAGGDPVVARVNGQPIYRSDVVLAAESLPAQLRAVPIEALYPALLNQVIDRKLTVAQAQKEKFDQDPEVAKRVADIYERVIEQLYLTNKIDKELSDDQIKVEYEKLPTERRVRASHVLVKTRDEAVQVIRDIDKGQKFEDIASKRSLDPSGKQGGDLGFFSKEQMVASFADAAFRLKKGEVTKAPVQTEYGWHVIRVEEIQDDAKPSFEEKRDELRDQLSESLLAAQMDRLRGAAKIERFALDGSPAAPAQGQQLGR